MRKPFLFEIDVKSEFNVQQKHPIKKKQSFKKKQQNFLICKFFWNKFLCCHG